MEAFEAELAEATNPINGDLLGAVAMVIDSKGERECAMMRNKTWMKRLEKESIQLTPWEINRKLLVPACGWTPVS
jgi:hypothetical protein